MTEHRTALVFPGQGSQRSEMLADVPETDELGRLLDAAEALSGLNLRSIETSSEDALADTRAAQPMLYLVGWAWGRALLDGGLSPCAVAGHSLGELTALAIAGVFSVEAGLELVVERSRLMSAAASSTPGGMAAIIGVSRSVVESVVSEVDGVWVGNDNSPVQVVITGETHALISAGELLIEHGARRVVPLKVTGPFHSPLMQPAADAFAELVRGADFSDATIPVLQNTEPVPTTDSEVIRERLVSQMTSPVRWTETVRELTKDGPCTIIEAGPGSVLTGLNRRFDGVTALSLEESGVEAVLTEVM